jgi:hypothetical protein
MGERLGRHGTRPYKRATNQRERSLTSLAGGRSRRRRPRATRGSTTAPSAARSWSCAAPRPRCASPRAGSHGTRLRAEKGTDLPDTDLPVGALTDGDCAALDVVAGLVEAVGLSFVRRPDDVAGIVAELDRRGAPDTGIVVEVEAPAAFAHLPELLVASMVR